MTGMDVTQQDAEMLLSRPEYREALFVDENPVALATADVGAASGPSLSHVPISCEGGSSCPGAGDLTRQPKSIQHQSLQCMWAHYVIRCQQLALPDDEIASYRTFTRFLKEAQGGKWKKLIHMRKQTQHARLLGRRCT